MQVMDARTILGIGGPHSPPPVRRSAPRGRLLARNGLLQDIPQSIECRNTRMLMSTDRILVRHAGSLPRIERLTDLLIRQEAGETIDTAELAREVEMANRACDRQTSRSWC
jgi:hypothetical protein